MLWWSFVESPADESKARAKTSRPSSSLCPFALAERGLASPAGHDPTAAAALGLPGLQVDAYQVRLGDARLFWALAAAPAFRMFVVALFLAIRVVSVLDFTQQLLLFFAEVRQWSKLQLLLLCNAGGPKQANG